MICNFKQRIWESYFFWGDISNNCEIKSELSTAKKKISRKLAKIQLIVSQWEAVAGRKLSNFLPCKFIALLDWLTVLKQLSSRISWQEEFSNHSSDVLFTHSSNLFYWLYCIIVCFYLSELWGIDAKWIYLGYFFHFISK